jgi:pyruvate/2-oxoglutarate dehydrogenase complex dihydrolipoamide dehydrogenase (E3) component/uncharacterized membrane protein YdjX (TVP38/TMEM64 family)
MNRAVFKLTVLVLIAAALFLFFWFDLHRYVSFENLKARQASLEAFYAGQALLTILLYAGAYIVMAALSLPGAAVMTLAGGALFGLLTGLVVVSFASTIGATLAFLMARFLLRDYVQTRFADRLKNINEGLRTDGAFYLFTLRLVPVFPFFVINLAMGLTPIRTRMFYLVSQLGMLPGTLVYVNAGTQLARVESPAGILSPALIASFVLLGIFPWIARAFASLLKQRRVLARFQRPSRFDYNLAVIGAGSAGLVTAYIAATVRAGVALIEKDKMGGDCLNTGCVPSKALIRSARMLSYARRAAEFGFRETRVDFDFADVMRRVQDVIRTIEPHDSTERYTRLGVECITGEARIVSPWEIEVAGKTITARRMVVATGAGPLVPPIPGLEKVDYLTSDTVWSLKALPRRLIVLGGGPIGCELSQAFARLGSHVTQVEMGPQIMGREDGDVADFLKNKFISEGIDVLTGHQAREVRAESGRKWLVCVHDGREIEIEFDALLVAVGRRANTAGFGLEELGVALNPNGTLKTNAMMQTTMPTIYGAGDVVGPYQFTHVAAYQAWYAAVNALFGGFKKFRIDYRVIPWATFTDPEVARVGLNETDAAAGGIACEVTRYDIDDLDRAIADSEAHGFVKVLTRPGSDRILGVTIVGSHAGDLIAEYILAMKNNIGLNKILGTIHVYPTLAEANRFAAGEWKKARKPEKTLKLVERYLARQRGKKKP